MHGDRAILGVDGDGVAFGDLALKDLDGQQVENRPLDDPFEELAPELAAQAAVAV